eukprot:434235-Lingulodinium_polyedra.AAC.1
MRGAAVKAFESSLHFRVAVAPVAPAASADCARVYCILIRAQRGHGEHQYASARASHFGGAKA